MIKNIKLFAQIYTAIKNRQLSDWIAHVQSNAALRRAQVPQGLDANTHFETLKSDAQMAFDYLLKNPRSILQGSYPDIQIDPNDDRPEP